MHCPLPWPGRSAGKADFAAEQIVEVQGFEDIVRDDALAAIPRRA
jgi:hypothetical protein